MSGYKAFGTTLITSKIKSITSTIIKRMKKERLFTTKRHQYHQVRVKKNLKLENRTNASDVRKENKLNH